MPEAPSIPHRPPRRPRSQENQADSPPPAGPPQLGVAANPGLTCLAGLHRFSYHSASMYQVYSQQRPGNPRSALLATSLVLLATVGMAWAVVVQRQRAEIVPLDAPRTYPVGQLRLRLPAGWTELSTKETPPGIIVRAAEDPDGSGRQICVFRDLPQRFRSPSQAATERLVQVFRLFQATGKYQDLGSARIGPLPAWTLKTYIATLGGAQRICLLGRAATGPLGETVGVVVVTPGEPRRGDLRLLEDLSGGLELLDVAVAKDPRAEMTRACIELDLPAGATLFANPVPQAPRLLVGGGSDHDYWWLKISRIPIIGGRTPEALLRDYICGELTTDELPQAIETREVNGRSLATAVVPLKTDMEPEVYAAVVQTDDTTGLFLVGRHSSAAARNFRTMCDQLAASARVTTFSQTYDLAKATEAATRELETLAKEGFSAPWASFKPRHQQFRIAAPGYDLAREVRLYEQVDRPNFRGWQISAQVKPLLLGRVVRERWLVPENIDGYECNEEILDGQSKLTYTARLTPGTQRVTRERVIDGNASTDEIEIGGNHASEPVAIQLAARLAQSPETGPLLVTVVETFSRGVCNWLFVPIGSRPSPDPRSERFYTAVMLIRDHQPDPVLLYFDPHGMPAAVNFDGLQYKALISSSGLAEEDAEESTDP